MIPLAQSKRIVIKLGTGVLTTGIGQLNTERISLLARQVNELRNRGIEVVIVSSGAVGLGMGKLGIQKRPKDLAMLQACAAIGQTVLMNTWQKCFDPYGANVAQILLTREDIRARHRHNAIFNTVERLLANATVPIVNENDTVSATEIKFGDNDTLSALVASVINADLLFILSNIPGLIDKKGTGLVVPVVEKVTPTIEAMAGGTEQQTSVGGMISKLSAAKIAQRAGCGVVIGSGKDEQLFTKILNGEQIATYFVPSDVPVKSHKRWIAIQDHVDGQLHIDAGATEAIRRFGKSLLSAGILRGEGAFELGDIVSIHDASGKYFAQGQVGMDADTLQDLLQKKGKTPASVVIHRNHLVLIN
ncbi:glutamate 5-kinase [Coraliomargarita parva]|uniref:glutamate 5-kinase n=1 Tax=Coraliomargarita parva TaxID=3014050 RepID=UPI0022B39CB0|nr:glutamate 5-kinase [Coraliomargarita parva]